VELDGEEQIVLVAEVRGRPSKLERREVIQAMRAAITREHQLSCHAVLLLKERTVPKTTSGKIQRAACKQGFLEWHNGQRDGTVASPRVRWDKEAALAIMITGTSIGWFARSEPGVWGYSFLALAAICCVSCLVLVISKIIGLRHATTTLHVIDWDMLHDHRTSQSRS
jgi:hypothetical protein